MKINLNKTEVLKRLYEQTTAENAKFFGCTVRAVEIAKNTDKFKEYSFTRNQETTELLQYATNTAVNALVSLLSSDNENIRLNACKAIIGAYVSLKPYSTATNEFYNVDKILVAIQKTAENET